MENHPIPQDITGFQFKLIGDMTIKQFAYLAVGIILGWITFILPIFFLIKFPLIIVFVGLGVAAAFLPIEGRPFDTMIINYFKALTHPTQYIYKKIGGHIWFPEPSSHAQQVSQAHLSSPSEESSKKLRAFLSSLPRKPQNKLDEKEMSFLNSLGGIQSLAQEKTQPKPLIQFQSPLQDTSKPSSTTAYQRLVSSPHFIDSPKPGIKIENKKFDSPSPRPKIEKTENTKADSDEKETELKKELDSAKKEEMKQEGTANYKEAHEKTLELEKMLSEVSSQKQQLENQILQLQKKLNLQNQKTFTPGVATPQVSQNVRKVPKQMQKSIGLPFVSDAPNLIMGIIKDPRGNPVPNILVEVKDEGGNPVRAFKTNVLGHFASATPLSNGTYTMAFEDPKEQHKFDTVEVEVNGKVLMPIEIISLDSREELRRSLFKNPQQVQQTV